MAYYAVQKGRQPGVYNSWNECNAQVNGYSGAVYKKFSSYDAACDFAGVFRQESSKLNKEEREALLHANSIDSTDDIVVVNPDEDHQKVSSESDNDVSNVCCITHGYTQKIDLYTDGACSGNPGPGGFGFAVVCRGELLRKGSGGLLSTTNNQMEICAVIEGLKTVPKNAIVTVYTDSSYVVNAFNKHWLDSWKRNNWVKSDGNPVLNRELWEQLLTEIETHKKVTFAWIKGHAGNKYNELCDKLAVAAIKQLSK